MKKRNIYIYIIKRSFKAHGRLQTISLRKDCNIFVLLLKLFPDRLFGNIIFLYYLCHIIFYVTTKNYLS